MLVEDGVDRGQRVLQHQALKGLLESVGDLWIDAGEGAQRFHQQQARGDALRGRLGQHALAFKQSVLRLRRLRNGTVHAGAAQKKKLLQVVEIGHEQLARGQGVLAGRLGGAKNAEQLNHLAGEAGEAGGGVIGLKLGVQLADAGAAGGADEGKLDGPGGDLGVEVHGDDIIRLVGRV